MKDGIQIISAPSILGLRPTGVEQLADRLLSKGLSEKLFSPYTVLPVATLNDRYSDERDAATQCLNPYSLHVFSLRLMGVVSEQIQAGRFPLVLGGDCSILLGIMPSMRMCAATGLISLDGHADFYEPEKSTTGEAADMDIGLVTGRGPGILTNIDGLCPYVRENHIIHVGQRDAEEAERYDSRDIRRSSVQCFNLEFIKRSGLDESIDAILRCMEQMDVTQFWLHFDTDVVDDAENPAVDYRLPGGLSFSNVDHIISRLLSSGKIAGMSVTIFNPLLDSDGVVAEKIVDCLANAFAFADW